MDLATYIEKVNKSKMHTYHIAPANIRPIFKKLHEIKVVLCDVYGTILMGRSNSVSELEKDKQRSETFYKTLKEFNLKDALQKINKRKNPAELLKKLYLGEIKKIHTQKIKKGIKNPEVKIEKIWGSIIKNLIRNGYTYNKKLYGNLNEFSLKIAYFHQLANEGHTFYKNTLNVFKKIKNRGIKLGLVSNAQFYTPIDLEIELRNKSKGKIGLHDMFAKELISFSYKVGQSKPNKKIFKKVLNNLRKKGIKKNQVVFIGNDSQKDIKVAKNIGFKTVLFAGDKDSLRYDKNIKSDNVITDWKQLLKVLSI